MYTGGGEGGTNGCTIVDVAWQVVIKPINIYIKLNTTIMLSNMKTKKNIIK
jgi:hypothetical protein